MFLYDAAAEEIKLHNDDINKIEAKKKETIKRLAKDVEDKGLPKHSVARQGVGELVSRNAAHAPNIYTNV